MVLWSIPLILVLIALTYLLYLNTQFKVYQDDQYKFSIKYLKSWKMIVHPKPGVAVIFLRPKETALDPMQESFNVTVAPLPKDVFTLEEFSNKIKGQMISVFGSTVHFVEYRPLHWGWRRGIRMSIEAPKPDNLKMVNAWVLRDGQSYIMTFLGNINKYTQDRLIVKIMIGSFRLQ